MSDGKVVLWLLVVTLLVTVAWFGSTLGQGFRSDDYLLGYYADPTDGAHWGRAFEEFARPWFSVRDLYRPLISVAHAACLEFDHSPLLLRALSLLIQAVTACAVGLLAMRLSPSRWTIASAFAIALVSLHPSAVEVVAWIAARTTGLETLFAALALAAFWWRLERGASSCMALVWFACALLSKEGAVAIPAALVALDVAVEPRRALADRIWLHAPFAAMLVGFFALRWVVLGMFGTAAEGHGVVDRAASVLSRGITWIVPPDAAGSVQWAPFAALLALAVVATPAARLRAAALMIGGVALFVPSSQLHEPIGVMSGRLVFPAVGSLALASSCLLVSAVDRGGLRRAVAAIAALAMLGSYGLASRSWLERHEAEDAQIAAIAACLPEAAVGAVPGKPCGLSMLPGLPLLHPNFWGLIGARPFAARDHVVVSLAGILLQDPTSKALFGDAALVHALCELGGGSLMWNPEAKSFMAHARSSESVVPLERTNEPGVFASPLMLPATSYAAVRVELDMPAQTISLALRRDLEGPWAFGSLVRRFGEPSTSATFDLTHAIAPLLQVGNGAPFAGVRVEVDGKPAERAKVVALSGLPTESPDASKSGKDVTVDALLAELEPPRDDLPLRLYLLTPALTLCFDVHDGSLIPWTSFERSQLALSRDLIEACPVHWIWQTPPTYPGEPWRSGIHWRRLR